MAFLKHTWSVLKKTFSDCSEDRVSTLAASLAFYTVFCIAPLLVIAVRVAGYFFGEKAARQQLSNQLGGTMGNAAAGAVLSMVTKASAHNSGGTIATLFSIALFVYAALILFDELQNSMNAVWNIDTPRKSSWWSKLRDQIISLAIVLALMVVFLISLAISTMLPEVTHSPGSSGGVIGRAIEVIASLVIFTLVFATGYKFLPDTTVRWKHVWPAAGIVAALFTLGKFLLGAYLVKSSGASIYGATGSVAVVLLWVYYSAYLYFVGAEFTQVRSRGDEANPPSSKAETGG